MKTRKLMTKVIALILAMSFIFAVPMSAQAATKSVTASKYWTKAPSLVKGTNIVTAKVDKLVYSKFKAPAAGTYKFTISGLATIPAKSGDILNGYCHIYKRVKSPYAAKYHFENQTIATNGGKKSVMWVASSYSYNLSKRYNQNTPTVDRFLSTRYAKIKLKKGETIYWGSSMTSKKSKYTLKIQKIS